MNTKQSWHSNQLSRLPYTYNPVRLKQIYTELVRIPALGADRRIYSNQNAVIEQNNNTIVIKGIEIDTNDYNSTNDSDQQLIQFSAVFQRAVTRDIIRKAKRVCIGKSLLCSDLLQSKEYIRMSKPILTLLKQITQSDINAKYCKEDQSKPSLAKQLNLKQPANVMRYANVGYDTNNSVMVTVTQNYERYVPISRFIKMASNDSEQSLGYNLKQMMHEVSSASQSQLLSFNQNIINNRSKIGGLSQAKILLIISRVVKAYSDIFEIQRKLYKYYLQLNQRQTQQKLSRDQLLQKCSLLKYINPQRDILVDPDTFQVLIYNFGFREDFDAVTYEYRESLADTDWVYRHPANICPLQTCDSDKTKYNQKYIIEGLSCKDIYWQICMLIFRLFTGAWPFTSSKTNKPVQQINHSNIREVHAQMLQISKYGMKAIKNSSFNQKLKQSSKFFNYLLIQSEMAAGHRDEVNPEERWSIDQLDNIIRIVNKLWNEIAFNRTAFIYNSMNKRSSFTYKIAFMSEYDNIEDFIQFERKNQKFQLGQSKRPKALKRKEDRKYLSGNDQIIATNDYFYRQSQQNSKRKQTKRKTLTKTKKQLHKKSCKIQLTKRTCVQYYDTQKQFNLTRVSLKIRIFPIISTITRLLALIENLKNETASGNKQSMMSCQNEIGEQKDYALVKLITICYILVLEIRYRCIESISAFEHIQFHMLQNVSQGKPFNKDMHLMILRHKNILVTEIKSLNALIVKFSRIFQKECTAQHNDDKQESMDLRTALGAWSKYFINLLVYSNTIQNVAYKQEYLDNLKQYEQTAQIRESISRFLVGIYQHLQHIRTTMGKIGVCPKIEYQMVFIERALKFDAILQKMQKEGVLDLSTFQKQFEQIQFLMHYIYIPETVLQVLPAISNLIATKQINQLSLLSIPEDRLELQNNLIVPQPSIKDQAILESSMSNLGLISPKLKPSQIQFQENQIQKVENTNHAEQRYLQMKFDDWKRSICDEETMQWDPSLDFFN